MMRALIIVCIVVAWVECKVPDPPVYSTDLETALRQSVLTGYEMMQRPSKTVLVKTTLNLLSLNYLDIKAQKLAMTAYFEFTWFDGRLAWISDSNYSNIKFIFSNELYVWRPAIIIENSVEDVDVISKPQVPMRIRSDGRITWTPGGVFTTHCDMDVTYYPLDIQTCDIKISTWAYTSGEVFLLLNTEGINLDFYSEHGEWELMESTTSTTSTTKGGQSFSRLKFTLKFRRRPLFHMLNTLFPVILMGFLTVAIFKLSPESGERVGLSLTILLAYAVYLTLISEDIPQTSLSASVLSAYLACILLLQTVAVFLTVIYLDMYFKPDEEPVPAWLHTFASCMDCRKNTAKVRPATSSSFDSNAFMTNREGDVASISSIDTQPEGLNKTKTGAPPNKDEIESAWDMDESEHKYTWKEVSGFLDKLTMYLYLFLVTAVTMSSMIIIACSYVSN